ncbi:N-acetyltransferase [Pseudomonas fragariae (ex Marin et al. 2024)]|uniref:N-acetyltransferase n=1 Tax=Pseudomonas fragariae (ex Marin et al. 2024) TaxID=3080056 RepID=A0ABU5AYH4_9PSED|nr:MULTISPECIES: N-acetyltransferase [unclassified Pseudomonas]MDV0424647.1 N-acetyltransferase [Pseudomonas sp. 17]MDX9570406.1 N-acetyltransferase [Pseudomonas sp. 21(2023)]MDX9584199.1 N-acetyltransferase [Pseudomonas sp. 19(2023)]MDY6476221.1 N-acetyltransferase [Pseudomonas sp. 18]
MAIFSKIRGFFGRQHAVHVGVRPITLVDEVTQSEPGHFVYPGTDFIDHIEVDGERVGELDYSINPLLDRLYINMIEVNPDRRRERIGTAVLWHLWRVHRIPIVPLDQYAMAEEFWHQARLGLGAAGAQIESVLCLNEHVQLEQQRWQHLVPESVHERRMRAMEASEEWPGIKARMEKEYGR